MLNEIDLKRADLNLLVLFDAVFATRHVGRAAKRLNLSPSAVSHGIGRLRRAFNDPLFLKHPKGVVPTSLAEHLAGSIVRVLEQARFVFGSAEPFDPRRAVRQFTIGATDGIAAVALPPVLSVIRKEAPNIGVAIRELQPIETLAALDAREADVALYPLDEIPARFESRHLYDDDFVIVARPGHALGRKPTLARYAAMQHLLVTRAGDNRGFVDDLLAEHGLSRSVVLTVPSFMWALAAIASSDLVAAVPRTLARTFGERFGVVAIEPPLRIGHSRIRAVATKPAMADDGVAWLMGVLGRVLAEIGGRVGQRRGRRRAP